ncbi:anti-sigma factor family protein [Streptomyces cavernae]|uniref:anti-sigma factor family protein n=1 Tax=Streptomyces cavernae TaxID=2259034 RepID=UPI000FEC06B7|nr:zf-HC2 domain-containing protein [Streptomyces cavernae]
MNTFQRGPSEIHETVGAYALGILDDAEATQFEAHLATCEWCAQQLDELAGMEPMLAQLADLPSAHGGTPALGEQLAARPSQRLSDRLAVEVTNQRAKKSRRNFFMLAASAVLGLGGVAGGFAAASGGDSGSNPPVAGSSAQKDFTTLSDKATATDPTTKVSATVAMASRPWGTQTVVELSNVEGPNKCALVAVSKNGTRETLSSWAVPKWGYGLANATDERGRSPLYVNGGAAMSMNEIDHFEVVSLEDDKKLVTVDV